MSRRLVLLGLAAAGVAGSWLAWRLGKTPGPSRAEADRPAGSAIVDPSAYVPADDVPRFDQYLALIRRESGIDIRMVFARPPAGTDLNAAAVAAVEQLGVGRGTGAQRGLLLYFDLAGRRLKVEVGYGLEAWFPDAWVAFLVDRHAPLFFDSADRSLGLRQLLRLLHARIRDAALGGDFDPTPFAPGASGHLSGGAGANSDLSDAARAALPGARTGARAAAGSTPEQTYARYLDLLAAAEWNPEAELFTEPSQQYLQRFTLSRAYRDFILLGEWAKSWRVETRGDLALLYFTGTPFASPHFMVRQGDRWRIDLMAEIANTKERVGGPFTWSYEGTGDDYTRAFGDLIVDQQGYRRIAAGDNRPLPQAR